MNKWMASLALAAPLMAGCGGPGGGKDAPAAASMTVTSTVASQRTLAREVAASGSIAAWQEMSLGVELTGIRVAEVKVEVGARVAKGQPLLVLDTRTLQVAARQAEASLAQARASLEQARAAAQRGESLLEQKLISSSNSEELRANLARAAAQVASAEGERDAARLRLGFATLRAPDAGIISSRTIQPGQIVNAGNELMRLIRRGRLEWRAEVSERDLVYVKPGVRVEVQTAGGERVGGTVRAVSPAIDEQKRTALVYADLPEPGPLRAGMFAQGRIVLGEASVMVLPRGAVVTRDGFAYVFELDEGSRVRQRRIEIGAQQGDFVEVRSGLPAGVKVALRGAGFLSDGDQVRVVSGEG